MQIYLPYPKSTISQKFGDNATNLYANEGLLGHPAYDWVMPWGTPILNCVADAYCYNIYHQNDPTLMDYRAVLMIVEDVTGVYEITYGHCSDIFATVGKTYQVGDLIANVGNTGPVYVGQHEVTEAEKDAGSHAGAHLHGPQVRILAKTPYTTTYKHYLLDPQGRTFSRNGYFYGIPNYDNGYNGCTSFAPYSTEITVQDYLAAKAIPEPPTNPIAAVSGVVMTAVPQFIQEVNNLPAPQRPYYLEVLTNILVSLQKLLNG